MKLVTAAVSTVALLVGLSPAAQAQVGTPASPRVCSPMNGPQIGPPAPSRVVVPLPRTGPLPANLTLAQALEEASARSSTVVAAEADVAAAEARVLQSG